MLPAVAILLVTWVALWAAQGIPTLCALASPCPAPDVRVAPALLFGGLMLVPTAILLLTASVGRSIDWVRKVAYIALVGLALVGLGAVLFSGGFTIAFV
ncbi:hypothetical protein ASD13_00480 [Microbacterium sp. Root1433D1]|nr:hypothetical protein CVS53_02489 [Microbacterium oxydans]KQY77202.1 hypothetical protein ASD13_00480 [Microbacterium sp. Root1433D1]